jgi:hypothetical protein
MKSLFNLFIVIILAGSVYAQQGFYMKPIFFEKKLSFNTDPSDFTIQSASGRLMQYTHYRSQFLRGFDVGMLAGYNFKRASLETGIIQDIAVIGISFKTPELHPGDSIYYINTYYDQCGTIFLRTPIRYYYRLTEKKNYLDWGDKYHLQTCLLLGLDLVFQKKAYANTNTTSSSMDFYQGSSKYITETLDYFQSDESFGYMLSGGLCFKLYKGSYNIFNFDVYGLYSRERIAYCLVTIQDVNGQAYRHYENTSGSGIVFSLTREFNLKTCIDKRRDRIEKKYLDHQRALGDTIYYH